jgi:hypothetical protein
VFDTSRTLAVVFEALTVCEVSVKLGGVLCDENVADTCGLTDSVFEPETAVADSVVFVSRFCREIVDEDSCKCDDAFVTYNAVGTTCTVTVMFEAPGVGWDSVKLGVMLLNDVEMPETCEYAGCVYKTDIFVVGFVALERTFEADVFDGDSGKSDDDEFEMEIMEDISRTLLDVFEVLMTGRDSVKLGEVLGNEEEIDIGG